MTIANRGDGGALPARWAFWLRATASTLAREGGLPGRIEDAWSATACGSIGGRVLSSVHSGG